MSVRRRAFPFSLGPGSLRDTDSGHVMEREEEGEGEGEGEREGR